MKINFIRRLQAPLLAIATAALMVLVGMNFWQERHSQLPPDDGIWWREAPNGSGLIADKVLPNSPGERAGIQAGDLLTGVGVGVLPIEPVGTELQGGIKPRNPLADVKELQEDAGPHNGEESLALPAQIKYSPVVRSEDLVRALYRTGSYFQIDYQITRHGTPLGRPVEVIPEPLDRDMALGLRLIGLVYLAIGIYVLFRRWTAPRATHFYLFCLVSFALYSLKYIVFGAIVFPWGQSPSPVPMLCSSQRSLLRSLGFNQTNSLESAPSASALMPMSSFLPSLSRS